MTLDPRSNYPSTRSYVLKLHRDAQPQPGRFVGRLEHLASGRHVEFDSSDGLIDWLAQDMATTTTAPEESA